MAANSRPTPPLSQPPSQPASVPPAPAPNPLRASLGKGAIAAAAVILTVLVFFGLRLQTSLPTLSTMAKRALPLELALTNGKPSLVEFYADWCSSCQAMVPTLAAVEKTYGDRINFVMLNVDNDKWLPEMLAYQVDGIPHFQFFDGTGEAIAHTLGEQPPSIMAANLDALVAQAPLPHVQARGPMSARGQERRLAPASGGQTDPRSHGAQVSKSP